jgi:hypothetical protein
MPCIGRKIALPEGPYSEHVVLFDDPGDIPRSAVLVEGKCTIKHSLHVCHSGYIPRSNILVECTCGTNMSLMSGTPDTSQDPISWLNSHGAMKHALHVCHSGHIPRSNLLVECTCVTKHVIHVCHSGYIPRSNILVELTCVTTMSLTSVTPDTSQDPISWLNSHAP